MNPYEGAVAKQHNYRCRTQRKLVQLAIQLDWLPFNEKQISWQHWLSSHAPTELEAQKLGVYLAGGDLTPYVSEYRLVCKEHKRFKANRSVNIREAEAMLKSDDYPVSGKARLELTIQRMHQGIGYKLSRSYVTRLMLTQEYANLMGVKL